MALSYKARRRWAIFILVIGLPIYLLVASVVATSVLGWLGRSSILLELLIYTVLGVLWVFPLKSIFKGIGQADPDADQDSDY